MRKVGFVVPTYSVCKFNSYKKYERLNKKIDFHKLLVPYIPADP